jgi:hypothetical protein
VPPASTFKPSIAGFALTLEEMIGDLLAVDEAKPKVLSDLGIQ